MSLRAKSAWDIDYFVKPSLVYCQLGVGVLRALPMPKFILPLLWVALIVSAAAEDTKSANLTDMGIGLCVARKPIPAPTAASDGELSLLVLPAEAATFAKTYSGVRVLLCNRTSKEISVPTCDAVLGLIQEAQDAQGDWKPIERQTTSWCGNSYFSIPLPPGQAWQLSAPKYTGTLKTKLRFKLLGDKPIYSQEFDGSINPSQFILNEKAKIPEDFKRALQP